MSDLRRKVTLDPEVGACYIQLADTAVAETVEYSEDVLVDLDVYGCAVGIEVLDLDAQFPLTQLKKALHLRKDDEPFLALFLPTLRHALRVRAASTSDSTIGTPLLV